MAKVLKGDMGIVPALDIDFHEHLERLVRETSKREGVAGYKLGLTSVLRFGLAESVRRLRDLTDLPILYDHQKAGADMPDMAGKYTAMCKEADVDGLILFPVAGPTAVEWDPHGTAPFFGAVDINVNAVLNYNGLFDPASGSINTRGIPCRVVEVTS